MRSVIFSISMLWISSASAMALDDDYLKYARCAAYSHVVAQEVKMDPVSYKNFSNMSRYYQSMAQMRLYAIQEPDHEFMGDFEYQIERMTKQGLAETLSENQELCDMAAVKKMRAANKANISKPAKKYSGKCECPSDRTADGKRCGKRSAFSKSGGKVGMCSRN